jgi:hypothetical protein
MQIVHAGEEIYENGVRFTYKEVNLTPFLPVDEGRGAVLGLVAVGLAHCVGCIWICQVIHVLALRYFAWQIEIF